MPPCTCTLVPWHPRRAIIDVVVHIPDRLEKPIVFVLLLYRRIRYGYAFRRIALTQGKYAIVDPDDFERLSRYKWRVSRGRRTKYAQRAIKVGGKWTSVMMHREIIGVRDDMVVDHINHNGLDNREVNLRAATVAQNAWNRRSKKKRAGFCGVGWNKKTGKWRVRIRCNGREKYIGYFTDKFEAAKAYDRAAAKYHGEFATLNFGH